MLKNQVNYKQSEMVKFLHKLNQLVREQECKVERAIVACGTDSKRTCIVSPFGSTDE